jgi:hypothetical protein
MQTDGKFVDMLHRLTLKWLAQSLTIQLLCAATLLAQEPVTSLPDLSSRVLQKDDRIHVIVRSGSSVKGRFDSVVGSSVRIRSGGRTQDISGDSITEIKKQRPDSNLNGLLIGLAAGAGAGLVATSVSCGSNDPECSAIATVVFVPIFAGGGAGVGVLIDQLLHKYDPIYVSQTNGHPRWRLSPLIARDKKGLLLTISF